MATSGRGTLALRMRLRPDARHQRETCGATHRRRCAVVARPWRIAGIFKAKLE